MEMVNCMICGRVTLDRHGECCEQCREVHRDYYSQIREYIKQHPQASIIDVRQATGIPLQVIMRILQTIT